MPLADIGEGRDAILTQFKTIWDAGSGSSLPVFWDDVGDEVPATGAYLCVKVRHLDEQQESMGEEGSRIFTVRGTVIVEVYTPLGDGLTSSDPYVKIAQSAFRGQTAGNGAVWFNNVRAQEQGRDGRSYQTNVSADFEYDIRA